MKYFLHDTSAFDDEKITELYLNFGYEGLGLFYTALEKLARQEKPIKTDILKAQLKIGKRLNKCWEFIEEIGIISSSNGESFSIQLLNFSEKYQIKKEKTRKKVSEWREKQEVTKTVTGYVPKCNPDKVKLSKVKLINDIYIRESKFQSEVFLHSEYPDEMLKKFVGYWTEPNKSKSKMRFEMEKTWDLTRRLNIWASNQKGFVKSQKPEYHATDY